MADEVSGVAELSKIALETYRDEYRDLSETWKHLDNKAQGMGAIAGVFLAAAFAWARDGSMISEVARILIGGSIVLLVATVIFAVWALQVRQVAAPPLGDETAEMIRDVLEKQTADEAPQRLVALYNDQMTAWRDTNADTAQHNRDKARLISIGQTAFVLAAVLVAILSISAVWNSAE